MIAAMYKTRIWSSECYVSTPAATVNCPSLLLGFSCPIKYVMHGHPAFDPAENVRTVARHVQGGVLGRAAIAPHSDVDLDYVLCKDWTCIVLDCIRLY